MIGFGYTDPAQLGEIPTLGALEFVGHAQKAKIMYRYNTWDGDGKG